MFGEVDLEQREIDPPTNRWCSCGHEAPAMFRRSGPNSPQEPTRFFMVSNKDGFLGNYCEMCLVIAHHIAQCKKKGLIK